MLDPVFQTWSERGLGCVHDFFSNGTFITFQQMVQHYSIPQSHFFRYLQVRDYVKKNFSSFPTLPDRVWIDECLDHDPSGKGLVSRLYYTIQAIDTPSLNHIKEQWQEELGREILDVNWQYAIQRIHSSSKCIRHGVLQFKICHRLHLSRAKLAKIYAGSDPTCLRCHQDSGTLYHMFWACSKLRLFWSAIFDTYTQVFGKDVDPDPMIGIFGIVPLGSELTIAQSEVLAFSSLLARRLCPL